MLATTQHGPVRSTDGGATWQTRGNAGGPPQAFTATDRETVVVALANEIVRSIDGGTTFTRIADKGRAEPAGQR